MNAAPQSIGFRISVNSNNMRGLLSKGENLSPLALIMRVDAVEFENAAATSYLFVSKISSDKICIVESIPDKKVYNANAKARVIADLAINKECLVNPPLK